MANREDTAAEVTSDAIQRVAEAAGFKPAAAAFALGYCNGDEIEAIAMLWGMASDE